MVKFFLPTATNETEAEDIYEAAKQFATQNCGPVADRRIQSIRFQNKGKSVVAEVGKIEPITGETVIAILESSTYLVCTLNRGVIKGLPILVGKHEVTSVTDFE